MLLTTTEIRWFWPANETDALHSWFSRPHPDLSPEIRTDLYLYLPQCQNAGIKLRNGRLEVKLLLGHAASDKLPYQLRGHIQRWLKWSVEHSDFSTLSQTDDNWCPINKIRWQRFFSVTDGDLVELTAEGDRSTANCRAELTQLSIGREVGSWFSLGFEADAVSRTAETALRATLLEMFRQLDEPPGGLHEAVCLSYPEWLDKLNRRGYGQNPAAPV